MKAGFRIFVGIAAATVLVVAGLGAGWFLWGQRLWAPGMGGVQACCGATHSAMSGTRATE